MSSDDDIEPLYDPKSWCTADNTARREGETQEQWTTRLLDTAVAFGDHEFVERFQARVAERLLGAGQPVPEA